MKYEKYYTRYATRHDARLIGEEELHEDIMRLHLASRFASMGSIIERRVNLLTEEKLNGKE